MNVTLKDISKATGYSANTVSRALRGSSEISQTTTEYIRRVAKEMGYIANSAAVSLRSGRSRSVAVIIGCIFNPHFSIMIKGIEEAAAKDGCSVFVLNTNEDEETERQAIFTAIGKKADGLILCPSQRSEDNVRLLQTLEIPFVLLGRYYPDIDTNYVICDDYGGGKCAAEYLLQKGNRELTVLLPPDYISSSRERLCGAMDAMKKAGLPESACHIVRFEINDPLSETLEKERKTILSSSAVFCFSDMVACELIYWLRGQGIPMPGGMDVIGFDDIQSRIMMPIRIRSIKSYKGLMSHSAYETLAEKIKDPNTPNRHVVISTNLSDGETA